MNYLCQRCNKKKATVHITDTAPKKGERHLCDACAENEGVIVKQQHYSANALIQEFIKHKTGGSESELLACPKCGLTFREFQTKGLLGCPNDYDAFRSVLAPLIERAHGGATTHSGKIPSSADGDVNKQAGLLRLRRELQEALEQENYERAARVRDQIRSME